MKPILLAAAILIAIPLFAQTPDHAILPEQCRADAHLWHSQTKNDTIKLSFEELRQRGLEMFNCGSIDSGTNESVQQFDDDLKKYNALFMVYDNLRLQRMAAFIERHGLFDQFIAEDTAGKR
jgi:hypothetical protein